LAYHIVLNHAFDLEGIARDAEADLRPRHCMSKVAELLGATIHLPGDEPITFLDQLRSKLIGRPEDWALARRLAPQLGHEDVVICNGEAHSFPLAALCDPQNLPAIVTYPHNPIRPKAKLAMRMLGIAQRVDLFLTESAITAEFLRRFLSISPSRVKLFQDQATDIRFFRPSKTAPNNKRPLIGSGGMEGRDYQTLAQAVQDLDIDVRVSAASPDARNSSCVMPTQVPSNMVCRHHEWGELRQLYQDADLMIVPLTYNRQQSGLTTLLEAMACRKPVIMTRIPGMNADLIDEGYVIGVPPNDPTALRRAIVDLLENPEKVEALAQRGYDLVLQRHNHDLYVNKLVNLITSRYESKVNPQSKMTTSAKSHYSVSSNLYPALSKV